MDSSGTAASPESSSEPGACSPSPSPSTVAARLRASIDGGGVAAWQFDRENGCVEFDLPAATLLQLPASQSPCDLASWLQHLHAGDGAELRALIEHSTAPFRFIARLATPGEGGDHLVLRGAANGRYVAGIVADHSPEETLIAALRRSSDEYEALFQSVPLPTMLYDPESLEVVRLNEAARRQTASWGLPSGVGPIAKLSPQAHERLRDHLRSVAPGSTSVTIWNLPLPRGGTIELEITGHDVYMDGRRLRVAIARDLTATREHERAMSEANERLELAVAARTADLQRTIDALQAEVTVRRRVEEELRAGEQRLLIQQQLLASSQRIAHVGHWDVELETGSRAWSDEAYRILGLEPGAAVPSLELFQQHLHPDDRDRVSCNFVRSAEGTTSWGDEYRIVRADGEVRVVHTVTDILLDDVGRPLRRLGIVQDITETRELQRALEARSAFLRAVLDDIPAFIAVRDRGGRLVMVNRAYADFVGESVEELERSGVCSTRAPEADGVAAAELASVLATGRVITCEDRRVLDARGRTHHLSTVKRLVAGLHPTEQYVLCIAIDQTERVQYELRRREVEKVAATGRMAARVAHEINNPLAGIKSAFRLVRDDIPRESANYHYVARIEREIDRIAMIVRQMFNLYRPPSDTAGITDLGVVLDDVAHLVESQLRERSLKLVIDGPATHSVLRVDDAVLRPVVFNLVQNAIEASPDGHEVHVKVTEHDDGVVLEVSDDGEGISDAIRGRLFEPFFTTKAGLTTGGLGLGLSIARSAVESIGGTLDFERNERGGTTFQARIPRHAPRATHPQPHDDSP